MSARDHACLAAAAIAVVLLLAGMAHRVMRLAIPDGRIGMLQVVRR